MFEFDLISVPGLFGLLLVVVVLFNSLHVLREYERGVIFRLGTSVAAAQGPRPHHRLVAH